MKAHNAPTLTFWRTFALSFFCMMGLASYEIGGELIDLDVAFSLSTFWWPVVSCLFILAFIGFIFVWTPWFPRFKSWFISFHQAKWPKNPIVLWGTFFFIALIYSSWVTFLGYIVLNGYFVRVFLFSLVSILGMILLRSQMPGDQWKIALISAALFTAVIFRTMTFVPDISGSPFSLGWSEASRYYYGSLFFSERLYGLDLPLSALHPSRYMLLSLPFVIPGMSIWVHRAWQVLLWVGLAGWAGYLVASRLKIQNTVIFSAFVAWVFLFLHLGPVYYHLLPSVILVYWGVDFDKPIKTFVILNIAAVWAGLSRINWIPVPFFLVLFLYFLERRWETSPQPWKYLLQPTGWAGSLVTATLVYMVYIGISGIEAGMFRSSFTSDLLWTRLWPNSTYAPGILGGTLLVSIPLWLVIYFRIRRKNAAWHLLKWLGFGVMMLALFLGGLVVSVKIGGGSNLHNMDAYFVLLLTMSSYLFWQRAVDDLQVSSMEPAGQIPQWVIACAIAFPVLLILTTGGTKTLPDPVKDQQDLQTLRRIVSDTYEAGGEILFISERQLLVFDLVPDVPLVPDYEKIELMEMAMAGNESYLEAFYEDISNHRFALIVSDSIRLDTKDEIEAFSEEHNVWVEKVMIPLNKSYKFYPLGGRRNIVILTPKG